MHREMKCRIIPLHAAQLPTHFYGHGKFLVNLTFESLTRALTWLDFSTRKLPSVFHVAIASLRGENASTTISYYSRNNLYVFHNVYY